MSHSRAPDTQSEWNLWGLIRARAIWHVAKRWVRNRAMELTRFRGYPMLGRKGASTMPKSHRLCPAEFRERIIELVRKGRTPVELGRSATG